MSPDTGPKQAGARSQEADFGSCLPPRFQKRSALPQGFATNIRIMVILFYKETRVLEKAVEYVEMVYFASGASGAIGAKEIGV